MTIDKLKSGERFRLYLSQRSGTVKEHGLLNTTVKWDDADMGLGIIYGRIEIISSKTEVKKL